MPKSLKITEFQKEYISGILSGKKIINPEITELIVGGVNKKLYKLNDITDILKPQFSKTEEKNCGITFTPIKLVMFMYEEVLINDIPLDKLVNLDVADLSAGNGAFFVGLFKIMKSNLNFSLRNFIENHVFAYELKEENAAFLKLIFQVVLEYYGEDSSDLRINLTVDDTLKIWDMGKISKKFDVIVGNPPYVKQQNLTGEQRKFLLDKFQSIDSNYNLYYAFVELSANLLKENGRAVLLVPNYLLKIKSAKSLRRFLIENKYLRRIIDFQFSKLFNGIDTYSMIIQIKKNSRILNFKNQHKLDEKKTWIKIPYDYLNCESINLVSENERKFIDVIKSQPNELIINTGIATLKDKVYLIDFIDKSVNASKEYIKIFGDKSYIIEPDIVVPITKGSGASASSSPELHYIIYPYKIISGSAYLISKDELISNYPNTYSYFKVVKRILSTRSGKYLEDEWYRYGRTQALMRFDAKIAFPTNTDHPKFRFIPEGSLLYNGYAVYGINNYQSSEQLLQALTVILNSSVTDTFMRLTSYFIGGGFLSYQKKYLEKFRIPDLKSNDVSELIDVGKKGDKSEIDKIVRRLYGL